LEKVHQAAVVAPPYGLRGNIVTAFTNTIGDPGERKTSITQPNVDQIHNIAGGACIAYCLKVRPAGQCRFESERFAALQQRANAFEHESSGLKRRCFGGEGRKALGDKVGIDKLVDFHGSR
jgi:hypothetical protein